MNDRGNTEPRWVVALCGELESGCLEAALEWFSAAARDEIGIVLLADLAGAAPEDLPTRVGKIVSDLNLEEAEGRILFGSLTLSERERRTLVAESVAFVVMEDEGSSRWIDEAFRAGKPVILNAHAAERYASYDDKRNLYRSFQRVDEITGIVQEALGLAVEHPPSRAPTEDVSLGIDIRFFSYPELSERGIGHYASYHLQALLPRVSSWKVTLFTEGQIPTSARSLEGSNVDFKEIDDVRDVTFDLVHIPDPVSLIFGYDSPLRVRPKARVTTTTFYDLIPLKVRDQHFDTWDDRLQGAYLGRLEQLRRSDVHLLAISECTRRDLVTHLRIDPSRVHTILAGYNFVEDQTVDEAAVLRRIGISQPFFLMVGAIEKHKNFPTALQAFLTCSAVTKCELVVVGSFTDPYKAHYKKLCDDNGITQVRFPGFLPRSSLVALYRRAVALLFPSLYEGFGFPVLEAMANGCPVIASHAASIPEVAGGACRLLPPDAVAEWASAMGELLEAPSLQQEMRRRGTEQASRFTWQRTADLTLDVWRSLLSAKQ